MMTISSSNAYVSELEDKMNAALSALREKGASKNEIKKCKNAYFAEINHEISLEEKKKILTESLQKILEKENCLITEEKLRKEFFSTPNDKGTWSSPLLCMKAVSAMRALKVSYIKETYSENTDYKNLHNKIVKLRDSLRDICQLMHDPDIRSYYAAKACQDHEVSPHIILGADEEFFKTVRQRGLQLDFFLYEKKKQGRPSYPEFYDFVYQVAKIYEKISGKKFTLDKYKGTSGKEKDRYSRSLDQTQRRTNCWPSAFCSRQGQSLRRRLVRGIGLIGFIGLFRPERKSVAS